jgi:REP element-mobilizing transposase RayT
LKESAPDVAHPPFVRKVLGGSHPLQASLFESERSGHVWQRRFYDFNVDTDRKRIEKLRSMHRNPVKRGLVELPEQWRWSSYRWYAYQEEGPVRINEWGVLKMKLRAA